MIAFRDIVALFVVLICLLLLLVVTAWLMSGAPAQQRQERAEKSILYGPGSCLTIQEHMVFCEKVNGQ